MIHLLLFIFFFIYFFFKLSVRIILVNLIVCTPCVRVVFFVPVLNHGIERYHLRYNPNPKSKVAVRSVD